MKFMLRAFRAVMAFVCFVAMAVAPMIGSWVYLHGPEWCRVMVVEYDSHGRDVPVSLIATTVLLMVVLFVLGVAFWPPKLEE